MKKTMNKIAALAALSAMALTSLTGCASKPSQAQTEAASTEAAASSEAPSSETSADADYTIGICQLVQHQALDQATQGFQDALNKLGEENGVTFAYDLQNAQGDSNVCATIANNFVAKSYDLIMANATPSLQACANATNEIPVLATSITNFSAALDIELAEDGSTGINVSGTNDLAPLSEQAKMVRDLNPDAKTVGIIYCSAEINSAYQAEHIIGYLEDLDFEVTEYSFADSNDLQAIVSTAVSEVDTIYIPTDNTAAANAELIDNVARPAGIKIITGDDGTCKGCGLATFSVDFYAIGYRTGEMAYDILVNGADVSTMPVEDPSVINRVYNAEIAEYFDVTLGDEYTALGE